MYVIKGHFRKHIAMETKLRTHNLTSKEASGYGSEKCIAAYLLKARTAESEKQPLIANGSETNLFLGNGSVNTFPRQLISMQQ
jgi:hypothetical protein